MSGTTNVVELADDPWAGAPEPLAARTLVRCEVCRLEFGTAKAIASHDRNGICRQATS